MPPKRVPKKTIQYISPGGPEMKDHSDEKEEVFDAPKSLLSSKEFVARTHVMAAIKSKEARDVAINSFLIQNARTFLDWFTDFTSSSSSRFVDDEAFEDWLTNVAPGVVEKQYATFYPSAPLQFKDIVCKMEAQALEKLGGTKRMQPQDAEVSSDDKLPTQKQPISRKRTAKVPPVITI